MDNRKLTSQELEELARLGSPRVDMLAAWANKQLTCSHCKRCTIRCEVLESAALDMGLVEEGYRRVMALAPGERTAAVLQLVNDRPDVYQALRRCCFCGYCTAACRHHVLGADRMRDWRELFMQAGLMPPDDSKLVMVDNEWHIFSAYRAIYGVGYPEFVSLAQAAEHGPGLADTVFFPGCSLVSYAPELTRKVGRWLTAAGVSWALSDDCCGSPLMSAGLFDRAAALRGRILEQMRAAGVTRMLTVCPGCGEEFAQEFAGEVDIVPLPEFLLEAARGMQAPAGVSVARVFAGVAGGEAGSKVVAVEGGADASGGDGVGGVGGHADEVAGGAAAGQAEATATGGGAGGAAAGGSAHPSLSPASVTVFDSCHDRADGRHGAAIRALLRRCLPDAELREMDHRKRGTLCCGAGGAVSSFDGDITNRRVWRVIEEARATGAQTLVTMCPTCTYTVAQACLEVPGRAMENHHYLELLFDEPIDWAQVFDQLGAMWTGEYGPWLMQTFY